MHRINGQAIKDDPMTTMTTTKPFDDREAKYDGEAIIVFFSLSSSLELREQLWNLYIFHLLSFLYFFNFNVSRVESVSELL